MTTKARQVQIYGVSPAGAPDPIKTDGSGAVQTSGGGGGGGGTVAQGAGAATGASPWYVAVVDGAGALYDLATSALQSVTNVWLENIAGTVALDSTLAAFAAKFSTATLSGTLSDSITTALIGAAMLARDENTNHLLRVSIDANNRALNVRCYPRAVITVLGSNNGTGSSATWGRRLSVATFGVSFVRVAAVNKGASDAFLFIKDKASAISAGETSKYAPRLVRAGGIPTELGFIYPEDTFSNGIQLGLSSTAATYTEIAADDAFFECSRI